MARTSKQAQSPLIPLPVASAPVVSVTIEPLALSLSDAARVAGLPVWTLREAIMVGTLRAKHGGRNHVVLLHDLRTWLDALDDVAPSTAPSILVRQQARL